MVDPIGAAGLALAGLTLPAQVFSSCVLAYTTISDIKTTGRQLNALFWLFKIQHTRFLVWGQNSDVYRDGVNPENLSQPVYEMVVSTLMQIKDLLQDFDRLREHYGIQELPASNIRDPQVSNREIRRQATMVFQVQKSCSLFRKLKWAVYDRDKFAGLVNQLTQYNDALYQFSPLIKRPSQTVAIEAEALATAIVDEGWQGVQYLQDAVSNGQMRPRTTACLGGMELAAVENGLASSQIYFTPSRNLLMDFRQIQMLRLPNETPKRRAWAQLSMNTGYAPSLVVVEWRPYNQMNVVGQIKAALQIKVEALVKMLQQGPKPPGFRILDCLGYLEDNQIPRFGLVFRYPHLNANQAGPFAPLTLFQIISKEKPPYLGDRFQLAGFLAESLYELHSSRWLHKSVNSHNILFFRQDSNCSATPQSAYTSSVYNSQPQPSLPSPISLMNPYFAGFALARPDDPTFVSSQTTPDPDVGIYRHPDVQGLGGRPILPYHCLHDIYSLGAVLLEIGTWSPLAGFYQAGQTGPPFRDRLLSRKVPLLGVSMGEKYMIAVRKCLDGRFDGMQLFQDHEKDEPDYILNLQRSFYWEVVKTLKECHV
jgi:hypothetical protein